MIKITLNSWQQLLLISLIYLGSSLSVNAQQELMQQFAQQEFSQWQFHQELIDREQPEEEAEEVGAIIKKDTVFWGAAGKNSWDGTLVTLKRKTTHIPICFSQESEVYFDNNRGEYQKDWQTYKTRIQNILKRWTSYANLEFDFKNSCAEINNKNYSVTIKLQNGGDYIGKAESLGVDNENNIGIGNKDGVAELYIDAKGIFSQYTWLHEMGHVLGFVHEHAHQNSTCSFILERFYAKKRGYIQHFAYDDRSIMSYCSSGSRVAVTLDLDREAYLSSTDHRATMMVYGVKPNFSGVLRDINNKYKYFINGQYQKDFSSDCHINQEGHLTGLPLFEPTDLAKGIPKVYRPICIQKGNTLETITYNNNPYTGVFYYKINGINKELYIKEGKYNTGYTGEAYDVKGHLYSIVGGNIYPSQYTGIATINGSMFAVINGTLDREFTGVLENNGSPYGFVNGEPILPYKLSRYKDNKWLALQDRTGKYHAFIYGVYQKNDEDIICKGSNINVFFSPRLYIPTENRYTCFPKEDGAERAVIQNKYDENPGLPTNGIRINFFHDKEPLLLVNGFHRPSYTGVVGEVNYYNGIPAAGEVNGIKYAKNGKPLTGFYKNKFFKNGELATGFYKNKFFKNGMLFTGLFEEKYYKDGNFQSNYQGLVEIRNTNFYVNNGELAKGLDVYQDKLYLNGGLDKGITVYRDYLYISGSRLSFYEHFKYEDWNYFIYDGVLYTNLGSIYNGNALACNSSQTGPVKCVWADSYYTDGNVYKYHTNNNKNDTAKTGFEGEVYYERDIRYAGKYCKDGTPFNNFKEVTDSSKCQSYWGSNKVNGPGWYSSSSWQRSWWSWW